jgi:predicted GNAT family N-acyltransferase
MTEAIFIDSLELLEEALKIRQKVFVEEQNVPFELERNNNELDDIHVLVYEDKVPVATGKLIINNNEYLIGRIAVLSNMRGKSYGDLVVKMLIHKAFSMGANKVQVHSQLHAVDFYKKIGFECIGEIYKEINIEHITMYINENMIKKCCG